MLGGDGVDQNEELASESRDIWGGDHVTPQSALERQGCWAPPVGVGGQRGC